MSKREKVKSLLMCICLTCIASTSRPTIARANTPCWNNRHITACITFTLLWCHQQEGAAFTVQWSGFCEFNSFVFKSQNVEVQTFILLHYQCPIYTDLVSHQLHLLFPGLFLQCLLFLVLRYLDR